MPIKYLCWWIQKPAHYDIYLCTFVRNCWFKAKVIFHLDPDTICSWFKCYGSICRKTHPCWQGLLLIKKKTMTQISSAICQRLQLIVDFEIEMFCSFETVLQLGFKQSPDASEKLVQTLTVFLALSLIQFSNESDILFKFLLFVSTCLVYHL